MKNSLNINKLLLLILSVIFLYTIYQIPNTNVAQAQVIGNLDFLKGIVPCGTSYAPAPCTVCHFFKLLQNIINFLLLTSASLVTLMAAYIGFLFMFSGGSPQKITDARSKLWLLVWGIAWVLGSWLVLNTMITVFAEPGVFPWPWNQINC